MMEVIFLAKRSPYISWSVKYLSLSVSIKEHFYCKPIYWFTYIRIPRTYLQYSYIRIKYGEIRDLLFRVNDFSAKRIVPKKKKKK